MFFIVAKVIGSLFALWLIYCAAMNLLITIWSALDPPRPVTPAAPVRTGDEARDFFRGAMSATEEAAYLKKLTACRTELFAK
jgi:hypothetical protein